MNEATEEVAPKAPAIEIIRGRMPLPMVFTIRFLHPDASDGELAALYRTTAGKVTDIRKRSNFAYVSENYKFTEEQMAAATSRLDDLDDKDGAVATALEGTVLGTSEEISAQDAERISQRKSQKPAVAQESEELAEEGLEDSEVADEGLEDDLSDLID